MKKVLPVIILSQFFCTSLWFAGNSILADLARTVGLAGGFLAHLTSAVQVGFIAGTLLFAILALADRISPSRVFFVCSLLAALVNLGMVLNSLTVTHLLVFRFLTGFFLAGIYPVGMKIASDYYQRGLGVSLGFLVGALVLGTAFPHIIKTLTSTLPWKYVVYTTSGLSVLGGLAMWLLVPDGPFRPPAQGAMGSGFAASGLFAGFRQPAFRAAALGYFGHMWELYAFWAFVPVILTTYNQHYPAAHLNVSLWSFGIIASGGVSCAVGGLVSRRAGPKRVATVALSVSGVCCLLSPVFLWHSSVVVLLGFLFVWGTSVVADSPQFSTLVAQNAPETGRGAALTLVNCIGFAITIVSIQLLSTLAGTVDGQYLYLALALGPLAGLLSFW